MLIRGRIIALASIVLLGCYSAATDPGAALPGEVASIRLIDQTGTDRTGHLPLFPGLPESLTVHPYRADGSPITVIEGGATCTFAFSPTSLAVARPVADPLTKVVTTTSRPGAGGAFYVTLQFPYDTAAKTFGPFDVLIH